MYRQHLPGNIYSRCYYKPRHRSVNDLKFHDLAYVVSLEYYRAVASAVGATEKPQLILYS